MDYVVNLIGIDHVSFGADNTLDGNKDDKGTADQAVLYPAVVGAYNSCVGTRSDERHAKGFEGCWQLEMTHHNEYVRLRSNVYAKE